VFLVSRVTLEQSYKFVATLSSIKYYDQIVAKKNGLVYTHLAQNRAGLLVTLHHFWNISGKIKTARLKAGQFLFLRLGIYLERVEEGVDISVGRFGAVGVNQD
jgi:hypothetical protein